MNSILSWGDTTEEGFARCRLAVLQHIKTGFELHAVSRSGVPGCRADLGSWIWVFGPQREQIGRCATGFNLSQVDFC